MYKMWKKTNNTIEKTFTFENFTEALNFVNAVGEIANKNNHHPDILLFSYKKVKITLTTHDEGKVTNLDTNLAKEIDKLT